MKKIAMLAAGMLLGMNVYGAALDTVPVASAEVENAVKSTDDSIFKVVQPMKEYPCHYPHNVDYVGAVFWRFRTNNLQFIHISVKP